MGGGNKYYNWCFYTLKEKKLGLHMLPKNSKRSNSKDTRYVYVRFIIKRIDAIFGGFPIS